MKNPRDIMLVGIGFLLGIVFCYFVTAARLAEPKRGDMNFVFSSKSQTTNVPAAREINLFPKKAGEVRIEDPIVRGETRPRYVPVRRLDSMFRISTPGGLWPGAGQYDLIDFNYVPDFKLPAD